MNRTDDLTRLPCTQHPREMRVDNESRADFKKRSYVLAGDDIANANATAEKLKRKCFIVFVME